MRLYNKYFWPSFRAIAAVLIWLPVLVRPAFAADPDDYTATLICRSLTAEPGQQLSSALDPHYIAEYPVAYADLRLKISAEVRESGEYQFFLILKPAGKFSAEFKFELEKFLAAGSQIIEVPVDIAELQRQRGLLWSIVPEQRMEVELTVSRLVLPAEVERRTGINRAKMIDELKRKGVRPSDLAVLEVPPDRAINKFVSRTSYTVDLAPVERKMAR